MNACALQCAAVCCNGFVCVTYDHLREDSLVPYETDYRDNTSHR